MHQPYYKDTATGKFLMPWVRFHSIKSYFDMVDILEDFPEANMTFNLVPSLLSQIEEYASGTAVDPFLEHFLKPASEMNEYEKKFVLLNFFMANWDTMVKPYHRYYQLLHKRGTKYNFSSDINPLKLTNQDYTDIQVWHNLTWFGYRARKRFPEINELIQRGRNFNEEDKKRIHQIQLEIIRLIVPTYKKYLQSGQIDISTSPFYHPIMPLVISTDNGDKSSPGRPLPRMFQHPEDVEEQLRRARDFHINTFGIEPVGLWPPEASVSPELVPLANKFNFKWMASDEDILFHSLDTGKSGEALYRPYRVALDDAEVHMLFRDRGLSDLIGFRFYDQRPEAAVDNLMLYFGNIADFCDKQYSAQDSPGIVPIILDGENPWEAYPDGGEKFLSILYRKLSDIPHLNMTTISHYLSENPPTMTLNRLHPGSWINHNFNVWIGHPEENQAWECISAARDSLARKTSDVMSRKKPASQKETRDAEKRLASAWEEIYIAEGSDWFWWYGDDFSTDNDGEFDHLFRTHVANVYRYLEERVPQNLLEPIMEFQETSNVVQPFRFITPTIDGELTSFYEWEAAGYVDLHSQQGAMHQREGYIESINFGFDRDNLFFRINYYDPQDVGDYYDSKYDKRYYVCLDLYMKKNTYSIVFLIDLETIWGKSPELKIPADQMISYILFKRPEPGKYHKIAEFDTVRTKRITELSIPFGQFRLKPGESVDFALHLYPREFLSAKDKTAVIPVERCPRKGNVHVNVPDENFEVENWCV
jgi:alpha-amylase/alpha-mannosidase (GH57 family)